MTPWFRLVCLKHLNILSPCVGWKSKLSTSEIDTIIEFTVYQNKIHTKPCCKYFYFIFNCTEMLQGWKFMSLQLNRSKIFILSYRPKLQALTSITCQTLYLHFRKVSWPIIKRQKNWTLQLLWYIRLGIFFKTKL